MSLLLLRQMGRRICRSYYRAVVLLALYVCYNFYSQDYGDRL